MAEERQRINLLNKNDLEITWFNGGPGSGGQKRNKCQMCCRLFHPESGARAQATEERSQQQNLRKAFERLVKTPQMKFWISRKLYELRQKETLEETVARETTDEYLKYEVKDENGRWIEVAGNFFDTESAKQETNI